MSQAPSPQPDDSGAPETGTGSRSTGKVLLKALVSSAIGAFCLWAASSRVDWEQFAAAFTGFDIRYLGLAIALSLMIQVVRAWRWKLELSPLVDLRYSLVWQVVAVAYMLINVLPFRLGEPSRPLLMSWKSGLPVAAIVGNWVFEKMMDAAAIVLFIHITLVISDLPDWAHHAATASLLVLVCLAGLVVGFWLRGEETIERLVGQRLPDHAWQKLRGVLVSARQGLEILPDRRLVTRAFLATIVLWSLPIASSYAILCGFGFDLPVSAAFAVFVAISAGTALPNPPGMVGVFQIAAVVALGLFGIPKADALAYGVVLNAVQLITLVLQGLFALPFLGVDLGRLTSSAVHDESTNACSGKDA